MKEKSTIRRFVKKTRKKRTNCNGMPKESVEEFLRRGGQVTPVTLELDVELDRPAIAPAQHNSRYICK